MQSESIWLHLGSRLKARWPAVFAVVTVLSFFFVPAWGRTSGRLSTYGQDLAHFPLFAAIAGVLLYLWPRRHTALSKATVVAGLAFAMALLVEIIQPLTGRTAAVSDLLIGAAGSVAVAAVYLALRVASPRARYWLIGTVALLILSATLPMLMMMWDRALARRDFPLLDSFERPVERSRWRSDGCLLEQVEEHATHGLHALRLTVPPQANSHPGAFLNDGAMDWSGYDQLTLDAFLEGDYARSLTITLENRVWSSVRERAQAVVDLKPGSNRIAIDIPSFAVTPDGQPLNLRRLSSIGLFLGGAQAGDALYLDRLSLSRRGAGASPP